MILQQMMMSSYNSKIIMIISSSQMMKMRRIFNLFEWTKRRKRKNLKVMTKQVQRNYIMQTLTQAMISRVEIQMLNMKKILKNKYRESGKVCLDKGTLTQVYSESQRIISLANLTSNNPVIKQK